MKVAIIDDEQSCRQALISLLTDNFPEIRIAGEAASLEEARKLVGEVHPDLVFLDIQLPDGSGFELLQKISSFEFHVIFITAYDQYAIQAIRHSAIDYLMKPVDPDEFIAAVKKSKHMSLNIEMLTRQVKVLLKNKDDFHRIALPTIDGLRFIDLNEVLYCKSDSNYTWFHLQNGEKILVTRTLKEYDETLSDNFFVRIHQSYLINIRFVDRYVKGKSGYVIMSDGTEINVSRRKKELFLKKMEQQ